MALPCYLALPITHFLGSTASAEVTPMAIRAAAKMANFIMLDWQTRKRWQD